MSILDQILNQDLAVRAWEQLQKVFSGTENKKIQQLLALKPIEVYETKTVINIDTADIDVNIKSYLENIIENRNNIKKRWFNAGFGTEENLFYNFHVVINGHIDYPNIKKYLQHNYVNQPFNFKKNRYNLLIKDVDIKEQAGKLLSSLIVEGTIKFAFFSFKAKAVFFVDGVPYYESSDKTIRVKEVNYTLDTKNLLLRILDKYYHNSFKAFLSRWMSINVEESLFKARMLAQEEMNKRQEVTNFMFNSVLKDLSIERILVKEQEVEAVFFSQGKLRLAR